MMRQRLPRGRWLVRDGGCYIVYDRIPGGTLGIAREDNAEELERLLALVAQLSQGGN
jgi:hypothetical protein